MNMALTPKNEQTAQKKAKLLKALQKTFGVVTTACKSCNISRSTHYLWCSNDEEYASAVNELQFEVDDFFMRKIYQAVNEGNTQILVKLCNSQRFKHLGFGDNNSTVTVSDNITEVVINVKNRDE